jgi:hypothetical protein
VITTVNSKLHALRYFNYIRCFRTAESKRFYLGDDDSDLSEAEDEPNQRRFSMSSGCSDDFVGGTNLNFDEDSGIGMSGDNDSNDSHDSQILPLRRVSIGKASKFEHKQQRTRRGKNFYGECIKMSCIETRKR